MLTELPNLAKLEAFLAQFNSNIDATRDTKQMSIGQIQWKRHVGLMTDWPSLQEALDSDCNTLYLPDGDYELDGTELVVPANKHIIMSKFATITQMDKDVNIFEIGERSNITIEGGVLTHNADHDEPAPGVPAPDFDTLGVGISGGTGPGCRQLSRNVSIISVEFRDIARQAITQFAGSYNWRIIECLGFNTGRAFIVLNGARFGRVLGCYCEKTGDDLIAFNNASFSCKAVGNVFNNGGENSNANGLNGINIAGDNHTIGSNVFYNCIRSISTQAGSQHEGVQNNYTAANNCVIEGNVIYGCGESNSAAYVSMGMRLNNVGVVTLANNSMICVRDGDGRATRTLELGRVNYLKSSNNYFEGAPVNFNGFVRQWDSNNDTFNTILSGSQNDYELYSSIVSISNRNHGKIKIKDARISDSTGVLMRFNDNADMSYFEVSDFDEISPLLVGAIAGDIPAGVPVTQITLSDGENDTPPQNNDGQQVCPNEPGLRYSFDAGVGLMLICLDAQGNEKRQKITLSANYTRNGLTLNVNSFTPSVNFPEGGTYIAFARPDNIGGSPAPEKVFLHGDASNNVGTMSVWHNRQTNYGDIDGGVSPGTFLVNGAVSIPSLP